MFSLQGKDTSKLEGNWFSIIFYNSVMLCSPGFFFYFGMVAVAPLITSTIFIFSFHVLLLLILLLY